MINTKYTILNKFKWLTQNNILCALAIGGKRYLWLLQKKIPGNNIPIHKDNASVKAKVYALVTRLLDDAKP